LIRPLPEAPATATTPAPAPAGTAAAVRERPAVSPAATGLNRPPKSTSLNSLVDRKTEETPPSPPSEPANRQEDKPFGVEDLIRCWDAYAETFEEESLLKRTMRSYKPVLLENAHCEVTVCNQMQKEELISHSLQLLKRMREQLSNSKIQMHIRIDEANEKKRAFTSIEKYELLRRINPLLAKLKDEFDLLID
jgi:DNA polymerase-3 subunit gamma/tau